MKKNNLVIASLVMLVFSIVSKISGFLRQLVFAYFYGASNITDAYIAMTTVATAIFSGIAVAVTTSFIPTISKIPQEKVSKTTSNIINVVILIIFTISIFATIFIDNLIPFVAIGFDEQTKEIAVSMARIILPFTFFSSISNVLSGYLQFNNVFWTIGISVVITNFVNMIAFAMSNNNTDILAIGYIFSWILPAVFFFIIAKKHSFKYSPILNLKEENILTIVRLGIPIFLGQLIFQFNTIIDRNFASTLGEGTMTSLQYANQLILFIITLFVTSITTAVFPTLSKCYSSDDLKEFNKISYTTIGNVLMLVLPITVAFIMLSTPIVELVYMRGAFDQNAADVTSKALMAYSIGIPFISLNEILNKQFYSIGDTKTPVFSTVISLSTNILLNLLLVRHIGYIGLCMATVIANAVLMTVLWIRFNKKIKPEKTKELSLSICKMLISSVLMGVIVKIIITLIHEYSSIFGDFYNIVILISSAICGASFYFLAIFILKVPEFYQSFEYIKTFLKNKKEI